mgnify:CR=1 FL=1
MARNSWIEQAAAILRKSGSRVGKRGSRIHDDAAEDNVHRLRAIDGICGRCVNLSIDVQPGKVLLRCQKGRSQLDLYRGTPLGEQAQCDNFEVA